MKSVEIQKGCELEIRVKLKNVKDYSDETFLKTEVSETVPDGQDPVIYLRSRLKEEINRHAGNINVTWKDQPVSEEI